MTKTKKEILAHLRDVAYTKKSAFKIIGFLNALGIIEFGENINFKCRETSTTARTYKQFVQWYEDRTFEKNVFEGLLSDLEDVRKDAKDEGDIRTYDKVSNQIMFLVNNIEAQLYN